MIWIALGIYAAGPVFCGIYLLALLRKDVRFVGFEHWYAAHFRLISKESRYARAWKGWAGCGLWGYMITNLGPEGILQLDTSTGVVAIRHEARHCLWWMALGGYHGVLYGIFWLYLKLFTDKDPYRDNWFERDARRHAGQPEKTP